jgi:hypothetical protein
MGWCRMGRSVAKLPRGIRTAPLRGSDEAVSGVRSCDEYYEYVMNGR